MESRKIFNFESKILEDLTLEKEGYLSSKFGEKSSKFIWASCRFCGEPSRIRKGFFNNSGSACHRECKLKEQSLKSPFSDPMVRGKIKQKNIEKYGVEFASQNPDIAKKISAIKNTEEYKEKLKLTNMEKYGVENVFQSEEVKEKIKKTNRARYGVERPLQNKEIFEKQKGTMIERYGVEHPLQNKDILNKSKETNIEKYGFDNPMKNEFILKKSKDVLFDKYEVRTPIQNDSIRKKIQDTNIDKYGSVCPMMNENIWNLIKIKNKEKFGYENPMQSKQIKEILKNTIKNNKSGKYNRINILRDEENFWLDLETKTLLDLSKIYNIKYNSLARGLSDEEFKERYINTYSFPKQQTQKEIKDYFIIYDTNIMFNNRKEINPFELDIYLPDKKFAIEFNGSFWHSEAWLDHKEAKIKHRKKLDLCREKGIRLFNIFENHWENRKPQLINFIKTIIGANSNKIHARKCIVTNTKCKQFIEDNHIQGYGVRTIKYFNLEHNGEIIACMTASKHHRQNVKGNPIVLNRLCFKDGVSVQGGASKLFSKFVEWSKKEGYDRILSWSDNCWTEGNIYNVLGFSFEKEYDPDYFYWNSKDNKYYSKQSQKKKDTDCPEGKTEKELAEERGLFRIWDCGKKLFQYML